MNIWEPRRQRKLSWGCPLREYMAFLQRQYCCCDGCQEQLRNWWQCCLNCRRVRLWLDHCGGGGNEYLIWAGEFANSIWIVYFLISNNYLNLHWLKVLLSAAAGLEHAAPSQNKTVSCEAPLLTYAVTITSFVPTTQQYSWLGIAHSMNDLLLIV